MWSFVHDVTGKEALQKLLEVNTEAVILVDFWAAWCGPCKILWPVLQELAEKNEGKVIVVKVDVDNPENQPLAMEYGVSSIPQVNIFKGGAQVEKFVGALPGEQIQAKIDAHL